MSDVLSEKDKNRIEEEEKYRVKVRSNLRAVSKTEKKEKKKEKVPWWKPRGKAAKLFVVIVSIIIFFNIISGLTDGQNEKPIPTPTPIKVEDKEKPDSDINEIDKIIAYSSSVVAVSEQVGEAMFLRSEIVGRWPNWTNEDVIKFAAAGISLENSYSMAKELTPPEIMVSVHQKMLKGLKLYAESVPIANEGIDNIDPALIEKSADMINEGTTWMNEATKEVEEITENL